MTQQEENELLAKVVTFLQVKAETWRTMEDEKVEGGGPVRRTASATLSIAAEQIKNGAWKRYLGVTT